MRQIDAGVSLERPTIQGLRRGRERDSAWLSAPVSTY
jgi:hypothetical protein